MPVMQNTFKKAVIETLETFAGTPRDVSAESDINIEHVKWLYNAGYLQGINASTIHPDGEHYIDLTLTLKGAELIEQNSQKVAQRPNRESDYEHRHPILVKIGIGITIGLVVALIVQLFK